MGRRGGRRGVELPLETIQENFQRSVKSGSGAIGIGAGSSSRPLSGSLEQPSNTLSGQWQRPQTVRELSSQITSVATLLLNGNIDLDTARVYSALARGVAQLVGAELMRARAGKEQPNLEL